jgi:hypothetical protein
METRSIIPNESNEGEPFSANPKSKHSKIGLVLGILGFIIYWSSLLIGFFLLVAGGGLDIINFPSEGFIFIMYSGLIFSFVGGILGAVGLAREENLVINTISFTLGALTVCTYVALTLLR